MHSYVRLQQEEYSSKKIFFSWRWKRENGKFKVKNIECALEVNNTGIIQLKVKEVIRTL